VSEVVLVWVLGLESGSVQGWAAELESLPSLDWKLVLIRFRLLLMQEWT
jgi:hypothetical protein